MEKRNSLLIVDDDASNLMELIHILQPDYKVFTAKDGESAIKKAEKSQPDLILLDIIMPGMSGFETLAKLKESDNTNMIPVIFITGLTKSGNEDKGLALGAVDYISKPFEDTVVKHRVRNQIQISNLQRDLETAVADATAANEAKSVFLANISHEIRTPMNVIVGLTGLLLEDDSQSDDTMDYLEKISTAGNTLMELINDVLDLSKVESGKFELNQVRYEIASLINDVVTLNFMRIEDKPIVLQLNIDDKLLSEYYGDDLCVKQILNNLLSNALKYTREGTVTLSAKSVREGEDDVRLFISVSDTGLGIRKEDLHRIFMEFDQAEALANRSIEGTGLGLSIVKKFTELMGGDISVESEYGKGSTFTFSIRQGFVSDEVISTETIESLNSFSYVNKERKSARMLARPDLSHVRVLVVDDFRTNLDVAVGMLGKYKMAVDCVMSGQEAIDLITLAEPVYDAVFMDHMMPGMDGVEATQLIRGIDTEYAKTLPVIALTANAVAGNETMFLDKGFQAFLPKPISFMKLDAVIKQWIMKDAPSDDAEHLPPAPEEEAVEDKKIEIPGINAKYGLSLYDGDRELFVDVIESYLENAPTELEKLHGVTEDTLSAYAIDIHTMKGGSAGIGARELADRAAKLEAMAKAGDLSGVLSGNESFISDAETLVADIKAWFDSN